MPLIGTEVVLGHANAMGTASIATPHQFSARDMVSWPRLWCSAGLGHHRSAQGSSEGSTWQVKVLELVPPRFSGSPAFGAFW